MRWIEGYERLTELAPQLPATRLVYVVDREADLLSLTVRAQALSNPVDWLLRAPHNCSLPDGEKLWTHTYAGGPAGQIEFALPARPGIPARTVRQHLWARRVDCPPAAKARASARATGCHRAP